MMLIVVMVRGDSTDGDKTLIVVMVTVAMVVVI